METASTATPVLITTAAPAPPPPPASSPAMPMPPEPPAPVLAAAPVTTFKSTETTTVKPNFWQGMMDDIHVRGSGLFMFVCLGIGVFYPELKPKMTELVALAATYLFGSAVTK